MTLKTARRSYTIQWYDSKQGGWTADGLGDSRNWPTKHSAQRAVASLKRHDRLDHPPRTYRYRIVTEDQS